MADTAERTDLVTARADQGTPPEEAVPPEELSYVDQEGRERFGKKPKYNPNSPRAVLRNQERAYEAEARADAARDADVARGDAARERRAAETRAALESVREQGVDRRPRRQVLTDTCLRGSGVLLLLALGVLAIVETSGTAHFWSWWWTLSVAFAWTIYVVAYPQLRRCTGFILNEYRGPLGAEVMVPPPKLAMCVVAALGCSLVMFGSMRILDNNTCLWWDRSEFMDAYVLTGCDTASHCGTYVKTDTFCDCVPAYQTGGSDGPVLYRMIESLKKMTKSRLRISNVSLAAGISGRRACSTRADGSSAPAAFSTRALIVGAQPARIWRLAPYGRPLRETVKKRRGTRWRPATGGIPNGWGRVKARTTGGAGRAE